MASGPTIVARFVADTHDMVNETKTAGDKMESSIGKSAKTAALAIGGAFAVGQVVSFGKAAVEAAAADEAAQQQLAAALKNTAGATTEQVKATEDWITAEGKSKGIADDQLRPALAVLARGFGDVDAATEVATLAMDIAAGTGKDLVAVSEALAKAENGQLGPLKKLDPALGALIKEGATTTDVFRDLSKTFEGQAAVAANSTAGQMAKAELAMGELQETIGTALLPVLSTLATFATTTLLPALEASFGWIMRNKDVVVAALVAVGVVVVPMFVSWAVGAAAAAAATIVALAPLIAIGAVVAGVAYLVIHNWDTIVAATKKAWDTITDAVRFVWDWIKTNWPLLLVIITGPIGAAVVVIVRHWDDIKGAAVAVWEWLKGTWQTVTGIITAPIKAAVDAIVGMWDGALSGITSAIGKVVAAIRAPINAMIGLWNDLEFRIPSFTLPEFDTHIPGVGKIGGGTVGGQTIAFPNLPLLAGGGVLTSPTLFVGGESGTEIVAPEALLRAIVRQEGGGYTLNIYPRTADASDIAYGFRRLELMATGAT